MGEGGSDIALTLAEYVVGLRLWWWIVAIYFLISAQMIPRWSSFFYVMAFSMALGALTYTYPIALLKLLFTIMSLVLPIYIVIHLRARWAHIQQRKNERDELDLSEVVSDIQMRRVLDVGLNALPQGIVLANDDGDVLYVNDRIVSELGYSRDEVVGYPIELMLRPRLRPSHKVQFEEFMESPDHSEVRFREVTLERKNGEHVNVTLGVSKSKTRVHGRRIGTATLRF